LKKNLFHPKVCLIFLIIGIILLSYLILYLVNGQPPITFIDKKIYYTYTKDLEIKRINLSNENIKKLGRFQWVKKFYLWPHQVYDISYLDSMDNLEELTIGGFPSEIKDWSPINNCSKLSRIFAWNVGLTDLDAFKELTHLKSLDLQENYISDISGVKYLTSLEELFIWGKNDLHDISAIEYVINLKALKIQSKSISDISPISKLKYLESLNLYGCTSLVDISSLRYCKNLKGLNISSTSIKDYSVLFELPNLKRLSISEGKLTNEELNRLKDKGVYVEIYNTKD